MGTTIKNTLKLHLFELFERIRFTLCPCCPLSSHQHVLHHAHVRKERIALKQIPNTPLLRRHINVGFRIKQNPVVENNAATVRLHDAGNALERH